MKIFACSFLLLLAGCPALGCMCASYQQPLCEQLRSFKGSALFVGVVRKIDRRTVVFGTAKVSVQEVTLSVEEAFAGVDGRKVKVTSFSDAGMCGYRFHKGLRYLVDASEVADSTYLATGGKSGFRSHLDVSSCGLTAPADSAIDSIRFLRTVQKNPTGAIVFGTVKQHFKGSTFVSLDNRAVVGSSVTLQAPPDGLLRGEQRQTTVDSSGYYEFLGLPGGIYTHTVRVPTGFTGVLQHAVQVQANSCAQVDIRVHPQGQ